MTSLPKIADFVNETFMFNLVFKFYNKRDTICLILKAVMYLNFW